MRCIWGKEAEKRVSINVTTDQRERERDRDKASAGSAGPRGFFFWDNCLLCCCVLIPPHPFIHPRDRQTPTPFPMITNFGWARSICDAGEGAQLIAAVDTTSFSSISCAVLPSHVPPPFSYPNRDKLQLHFCHLKNPCKFRGSGVYMAHTSSKAKS